MAKKSIPLILLVDDDDLVRNCCRFMLENSGYAVIEANCGHAAQDIWQFRADEIELLITDYDMPDMTGLQLSILLRESKPSLGVLMISGRNHVPIPKSIGFLAKPFPKSDFIAKVNLYLLPGRIS
jgi:FixJ family two-component response regulator